MPLGKRGQDLHVRTVDELSQGLEAREGLAVLRLGNLVTDPGVQADKLAGDQVFLLPLGDKGIQGLHGLGARCLERLRLLGKLPFQLLLPLLRIQYGLLSLGVRRRSPRAAGRSAAGRGREPLGPG